MRHLLTLCSAVLLFMSGVKNASGQYPLFPPGPAVVPHAVVSDGSYVAISLSQTLHYFGRTYSQLYLSMDGFLSFEPLFYDSYVQIWNKDIIAPLWTDIDIYTRGNISYEEATSGPLLQTATNEMNVMFPGFAASWVFVATWEKVEFEPDTGEVTFQVVLVSDNQGHTFALMNYGPIPNDPESWLAGLQTQENFQNLTIQTATTSDLSNVTNVGIRGRWAFQVDGAQFVPSVMFPILPIAVHHFLPYDGQTQLIQFDRPFNYFGNSYSQLYFCMDGFLSADYLAPDGYNPYYNGDIIAPLWTDLDIYTRGDISYEQATSGPLLQLANNAINRYFPASNSVATWVFVATWDKVEFEPDVGEVTVQGVLISGRDGSSYVLMNYGDMPNDPEAWMAGYQTTNNVHRFSISARSTADLKTTSNVGVPGRWAFQVNVPSVMFPVLPSAAHHFLNYDGQTRLIHFDRPFSYFGKTYTQLYFCMDGFLSADNLAPDGYAPYYNGDIIAPLWTDLDIYTRGDISYEQATSGPLLQLATDEINTHFPTSNFSAVWVLVATWDKVEFEPDVGEVTVQGVLISGKDGSSYVLMNYGDMPNDPEAWMAGYRTADNTHYYSIQASSTANLKTTTNVGRPGRWAFRVNEPYQTFFPVLPGAVQHAVTIDAMYQVINLTQPFSYFGRDYSEIYLSMDGILSFVPIVTDGYWPYWYWNIVEDIIAPLWTDLDAHTRGNISYEQATSGPLVDQATFEINRFFPELNFTAAWVFVATWEKMEFEPDTGEVTVQAVLISDEDYDVSFVLLNYGRIPDDPQPWMAGYLTKDNSHRFTIQASSTSQLSGTTNVGVPGRWAFRVDACAALNCSENEVCVARSGVYGCGCADDTPGNPANDFDATETCAGTSMSVSLSRCRLFDEGFSAEALHLNDYSCRGEIQDGRVVFYFSNNNCSTVLQTNQTHFIYENSIQSLNGVYTTARSMVSRDNWLNITFSCAFSLIQSVSMPMKFQAVSGVVSKILPGTESTYQIRMVPYTDASYSTPYSGDVLLQVNSQIFVAVEVDGVDSHQFSTVLDSCWATPYNDSNWPARWDLITRECPNPKDGTVKMLQNGVSTYSHFSFRMFTFTGYSDSFFLHCKVHLCVVNGGQCALPCHDDDDGDSDDRRSPRRQRSLNFHDTAAISMSF